MPIDASIAGTLTPEQIAAEQAKVDQIANAAQPGAITSNQFVFFAAFDGTNNDRNNLGGNPQSSNVGQLWDQYDVGRGSDLRFGGIYVSGVGTAGTPVLSSVIPTQGIIQNAELAFTAFQNQASAWLRGNPGGEVVVAFTTYSRGYGSGAMFSQMVYERGLVDPLTGKLLMPPGSIEIPAALTFDPVNTGTLGDLSLAPNVTNDVNLQAQAEFRWAFRGMDMSGQPSVTNIGINANHGGTGGGYDNGTGALTLEGATRYFQNSGLEAMADVPPERRFDPSQPVRVYDEGTFALGGEQWSTYGSFAQGSTRMYVKDASAQVRQTFDDGSQFLSYVNRNGQTVNTSKEAGEGGQTVIQVLDRSNHLESVSKVDADRTTTIITFGENGVQNTKRYDSSGNPVSITTPISANGTETNTVDVSTNTTLSTSQGGSGNPQDVSPTETGTAAGSEQGPFHVSMDPETLNQDHTPAGSAQGTFTTDNEMPGGGRISPSQDNWENVDFWAGLQASAPSAAIADTAAATVQNEAFNSLWWAADPLVLDLNGDGIKLTSYQDRMVLFDIDHDGGTKEQTGWVAANTITTNPPSLNTDGILAHDRNGNGVIDDISETLSEYYNGAVGTGGNAGEKRFADGFAALKSLDSNNDNVFNSSDASWGNLRVWVDDNADGSSFKDLNGDGVFTAGIDSSELKTFAELGITSINLVNTAQSGMVNGGNEVLATGNFVIGGQTREAQAANFLANPNGHNFINQQNGANTGTKIATQGEGGGTTSYVSHSTSGEAMNAATLGVNNLYGGSGNDTLTGDAGDNWLVGGAGSDSFSGGAGDDVLLIDGSDLQANIHAGSGVDIAQVIGDEGVTLNLSQAELEIVQGGRGNDIIEGGGRSSVFVRGGEGDDVLIGGSANDVLSGEEGGDVVDGGDGNDLIRGHRGRDLLFGGVGDDILQGGMEDDLVSGGSGNDVLRGDQGDDALDGGAGIDLAEFSGSFADYRITRIDATTYRVVDTQAGRDGADTLKNIERINFADVSAVDLTLDNPMPVKDVLTIADRIGPKLISLAQLLGNDIDWQADALHITTISDVKGGTIAGTVGANGEITPTLTGAGELTFTPDPNYTGVMSFKYKIADADNTPGATAIQVGTSNAAEMRGQVFVKTPDMPTDSIFTDQWYLNDINVLPVWKDYTGKGIRIGQFEPSGPYAATKEVLDYRHADLQPNIDVTFLSDKTNVPVQDFSQHATLVAGVMVAARNGEGAVGVAYNAQIAGWQIGDTISVNSPTSITADFFHLYKLRDYDVSNNSWGFTGAFENFAVAAPPVAEEFFKPAVTLGRGGYGSNIVMAGGNSRESGGNTNYSETTNNRFVITTGAINAQGDISTLTVSQAPFSNPGASILVSAPGSNVASTSRILMNDQGTVFGDDTANVEGTSFATPIITGVVALMLEANPKLGWRDVQQILALSARNVNDPNTDWTYNAATNWNGGGMHTSHDYGFGDVDARVAVRLAETWVGARTSHNERHLAQAEGSLASGGSNLGVAIADGAVVTRTLAIGAGIRAEHVNVTVDLTHGNWGDLKVELISPTGTVSKLVTNPGTTASDPGGVLGVGQLTYTFDTTHSYGEMAQGNWQLRITDRTGRGGGTLNGWKVDVYGSDFNETIVGRDQTAGEAPIISATGNNIYFYTDEFATAPGASRSTLTDTNGGNVDIVNASAVSGNSSINLNNGTTSTIAGRSLVINGDVEHAFGGDGNDTLTGSALSNRLEGGRGNDIISAGAGGDLLDGGQGNDTLTGGTGNDLFVIRNHAGSTDTIMDFRPSSLVIDADSIYEKLLFVGFENLFDWSQIGKTQVGADLQLSVGNGQTVILKNLTAAQVTEQATGFVSGDDMLDTYSRLLDFVTITGGTAGADVFVPGVTPEGARYFGFGGDDQIGTPSTTDLVDGGDGNDLIISDNAAPTPGNDWLEGGAGNDDLQGGGANDIMLGGSGNDQLRAGDGDDYLNGGTGQDYLEAGAGNDLLLLEGDTGTVQGTTFAFFGTRVGGAGADVFYVTANGGGTGGLTASAGQISAFNMVADFDPNQAGEKIDLSAHAWIRGYADLNIQNLIINGTPLTRISASNGTQQVWVNLRGVNANQINASHFKFAADIPGFFGGTFNDTLTGDAGGNLIDGGAGADNMTGRTGDDTYIVDNASDLVNELAGGGFDTVKSSVNYLLPDEVENLALTGGATVNGTGNAKANRITGNAANNVLDGRAGADVLMGGGGNDTYIVDDQADAVVENAGEGIDSVQSSVSFTLGSNIENLTLTGSGAVNATGNALGNSLTGNAMNNILDGAAGADTMTGGAGDDTYYVDNAGDSVVETAGGGLDTVFASVNHTLAANVENLVLHSGAVSGTGNELDNTLTGNTANNTLNGGIGFDILDGGAGADTMAGGTEDDYYVVDNAGDVISENANEGLDSVESSISFSLAGTPNVENLVLTGTATHATGNAAHNLLRGNSAANVLDGAGGNDFLDGGAGADTMIGGTGDDTYEVDNASDVVNEAADGGNDTVRSSLSFSLAGLANVENVTLTGSANIDATGNGLGNVLVGNSGNNVLTGNAGADTLTGGAGNDTLIGSAGNDVYTFGPGFGQDSLTDSDATAGNIDIIRFHESVLPGSVSASRSGQNLVLTRGTDSVTVQNWYASNADKIERVEFGDGTVWDVATLRSKSNIAPVLSQPLLDQNATEDQPFTFTVAANAFTDADAVIGDTLTYSATRADGTALPGWVSFNPTTRVFSGTPLNADVGLVDLQVTATDSVGASRSDVFRVTVANTNDLPVLATPILDQSATEDSLFTFTVPAGTFTDPDVGDTLTYSATRADGTALPTWLSFNPTTRVFSGTPLNGDVGFFDLRVRATDAAGASVFDDFRVTVANTNDLPVVATPILDQTAIEDALFSFTVPSGTFTDPDVGDTLTYSATRADGTALPTWLSFNPTTRVFSGTPLNANVGFVDLRVRATDAAGASAFDDFRMTVANTNDLPVVATPILDQTATEDVLFSFTVPSGTFTDPDVGDTLTYSATRADGTALPTWLSFNPTTRVFSGTPLNANVGFVDLRVRATDAAGASAFDDFRVTVANTNDLPVVAAPILDQTATEDALFTFTVPSGTFTDPDVGDTLSYSATRADGTALPTWLSFNPTTRVFSGTPPNGDVGFVDLRVRATDAAGASVFDDFRVTVANTNDAPTVANLIADQTATEDAAFTFTIPANTFADVDVGDTLAYNASLSSGAALPSWLSFNPTTRTFSGTPLNANVGFIDVRVTATDSGNASISDTFRVTVANTNDAPTVANLIADQTATEDAVFTFAMPANTFADVDVGDTLAYSASLSSGAALPSWLSFNPTTRTFSGTPLNANVGFIDVRVTATDSGNASVSDTFRVTVANTNDAPTVANLIADQTATEDAAFTFTVPANTFADVDVGDTLAYSATLSSGAALPTWLSFNPTTRTFTGTPLNANVGPIDIRVTATDAATASVSDTFTVTVLNTNDAPTVATPIADQLATEDAAFSFAVPANTFADVDVGDSFSYSAALASGAALPAWLGFNPTTRTFSGTPLNANVGSIDVRVTATDSGNASVSDIFTVAVSNTNDAPTVASPIADQTATEDAVFTFTVPASTFADVDVGDSLTYSASLADGTALPGWLAFNPTTRTFGGTPQNANVGFIDVRVNATDSASASVSDVFRVTVVNTNDAPTLANPIVDRTTATGQAFNFTVPANTFVDVDAGDTLAYSATRSDGTPLPGWLSFNALTRTFSGTPALGDVGAVDLRVTATDGSNASVSDSFILTVNNGNNPPTVANPIADQTATEDAAFAFTVPANTFADVDPSDSLTYGASLADGTALPSWLAFNPTTRTFSGTPLNGNVGFIDVRVTATDGASASVSDIFRVTVANTNDAPTVANPIADQTATEDTAFTFTVAANTFADVDLGDSLTYNASLADGTALPSWLAFNPTTRTFSGTPLNANVGFVDVRVTATDAASASASDVFRVTVVNTNDAPTVANLIADQTATEDAAFTFTVPASTFVDVDAGDTLAYSASLASGAALPSWLAFNPTTRTFSGTPLNANVGFIDVRVTATDSASASVSDTFRLTVANTNDAPTVANLIADQTATEDAAFTFTVPVNTFADVDVGDTLAYSATLSSGAALPTWLSFNPTTRTFSGTPLNANVGPIDVRVTATDSGNATASDIFRVTVVNTNDAPTVANLIADQTATEDAAFTFTVPANTFADVDVGDTLAYSATLSSGAALPAWLSFNPTTRTFSGTPLNANVGPIDVRVTATDSGNASASDIFRVTVANTNDAPTLANPIADQTATEDAAFTFTVPANTFADVDAGDTLAYSATLASGAALPSWLSFNATTRTFSGTPLNANVGPIDVRVTATDGAAASVSDTFTVTVTNTNDAPTVANPIADQTATEDTAFSFTLPANTFADVDAGDSLAYSASLADGTALPAWLVFNATTRAFNGTPQNANVGFIDVRVTATDVASASVSDVFRVTVANTNDAPTVANPIADQTATEDAAFSLTVPANTFADVDAGDTLAYSASLADGTALPAWLAFNPTTRTFSGTPLNANVGFIDVRVTATDSASASASDIFRVTVANTNDAPTVANPIADRATATGQSFNFAVPANTFLDVDAGDTLVYGATRGDGTALPSWLSFNAATRTFSGTPAIGDVGALELRVTATDGSNASVSDSFILTVNNGNNAPTVANPIVDQAATEDAIFTFTVPANTFADVDAGDSLAYSATLADGTALPSWLGFNPTTRTFSGTPLNANVGFIDLRVTATDSGSASVSDIFRVTVANTNDAPTVANLIADQTATEDAAFTFTLAANTFADVDAGDTLAYSASLASGAALPSWLAFNPTTRTFSGTPLNANVGPIDIRVTATDGAAASVSDIFRVTVANTNDAPTLASPIADQTATEDAAFTFTLPANTFADVDAGDSLAYSASLASGAALPSWLAFNPTTRTFSGTPLNANVGFIDVRVTATDSASASASDIFRVTVANTNDAPTVANLIADQTATEDAAFTFTVPANTFADVDVGDSLAYSAARADGTALPSWLSFNAATRTFSGTPLNANVGFVDVRVTATDIASASVSDVFRVTVANTNDAPTVASPIADQTATEDAAFAFTVPANTFADVDVGDSLTYSASLADGTALPSWLSFNATTRAFSGTPLNANVGFVDVRVTATDSASASASDVFRVTVANTNDAPTVANPIADQSASENQAFSFTVPANAFADVDFGDNLSYSATRADGTALPAWLVFNATTRTFSGTPGTPDLGALDALVRATDSQGASASDLFSIVVAQQSTQGTPGPDTLTGTPGDDTINGLAGNDTLNGGAGNDTLDGGADVDVMAGGTGNDLYRVDNAADVVTESVNEGIDTVETGLSLYTLPANVENLTLTGVAGSDGTGNTLDNVIIGNVQSNTLTGGAGNDTLDGGGGFSDVLFGGTGNDTYVVRSSFFVGVRENPNEGVDTVLASADYTLGADVENLTLTGALAINGTGNTLANVITGNGANNTLNGAAGTDTMIGGLGDDTYVVDSASEVVIENANEGTDTIQTGFSYTLTAANVENLTLTGTTAINGTGNALNNVLTGNSAANILTGGLGNDTYVVGTGDTVVENANEGVDTVQADLTYTLGSNLENLTLIGTSAINGTGNGVANVLTGNGANNTLNGGAGIDTMIGGLGNDTYVVDSASEVVVENANEGTDTIQAGFSYTLSAPNVENLTLTGTSTINGTGNALDNVLTGNSGNNILTGGLGNDTYVITSGDTVVENANEGIDTIQVGFTYTLAVANVENVTLIGSSAINATGNALDNVLTGNAGVNTLAGDGGNDTYFVGTGDTVTEAAGAGTDTVMAGVSWTLGQNIENLTLTGSSNINGTGNALDNVLTGNSGNNILTGGGGNDTYIVTSGDSVSEAAGGGTDTVITNVSWTLAANVENLTLTEEGSADSITGNALNNVLIGNRFTNFFDGLGGADTMIGGEGGDWYQVDNLGDVVIENANPGDLEDKVFASLSYTLGANVEDLTLTGTAAINATGNALNNVLTGNTARNVLTGGLGNDTYGVDNVDDVVIENANEGVDTVRSSISYTLGNNFENLSLVGSAAINGTGNDMDNVLSGSGNGAANVLRGGLGNDTYDITAGDTVIENPGEGIDLVRAVGGSFTLAPNVENMTITNGTATGNELNNVLTGIVSFLPTSLFGMSGDDILVNGNSMSGGTGNDTYVVDQVLRVITENANEGVDTVQSSATWTLGANLENLTLTGAAAINGTGNALDNVLTGNSASNTLAGGTGNDTYQVGRGSGSDLVQENDTTAGNTDVAQFLAGVARDQIWLQRTGNDLVASIIGTADKLTVQDWYLGAANRVEQFRTADGSTLLESNVQNLVNAMAAFAPPASGQETLPPSYAAALNPVIAANWQ